MLLVIPKVYLHDGQVKTEDILINDDHIVRVEPCHKEGITESLILLNVDPIYDRVISSTLTPEEIVNMYYRARQIKPNQKE